MWIEVDLDSFVVIHEGFKARYAGHRAIYTSDGLAGVQRIDDLGHAEYGQAAIVDSGSRTVQFGRDYLGHFPLSYACERGSLFISDDVQTLRAALRRIGVQPTLSEEAIALYFALGYVPHGMTPYREIVNCAAAGFYEWHGGKVRFTRLFQPVESRPSARVETVGEAIETQVARRGSRWRRISRTSRRSRASRRCARRNCFARRSSTARAILPCVKRNRRSSMPAPRSRPGSPRTRATRPRRVILP